MHVTKFTEQCPKSVQSQTALKDYILKFPFPESEILKPKNPLPVGVKEIQKFYI